MTNEAIDNLMQDIKEISTSFKKLTLPDAFNTTNEEFDLNSLDNPQNYMDKIHVISEVLRQTRYLFLYSILNKVCLEEGKVYNFKTPFQAAMSYSGVIKKEDTFYILDEDGDLREVFTSEKFTQFIDDEFWEFYENEE
jgi:hypothetical protein